MMLKKVGIEKKGSDNVRLNEGPHRIRAAITYGVSDQYNLVQLSILIRAFITYILNQQYYRL